MDNMHNVHRERLSGRKTDSFSIEKAIDDAIRRLTDEPVVDAKEPVQYWIWTGTRLVRASPEEDRRQRQREAIEQEELRLLALRQRALRQQRWESYRQVVQRLRALLRNLMGHRLPFASRPPHTS